MKVRRSFHGVIATVLGFSAIGLVVTAQAQSPLPLKIGVLDGFSGAYGDENQGEIGRVGH